jgi:hypothetical protein
MADFKIEAEKDQASGRWYVELYYPDALTTPIARTEPVFDSRDEALSAAVRAMQKGIERAWLYRYSN